MIANSAEMIDYSGKERRCNPDSCPIDPVTFGKLIANIATLTSAVSILSSKVDMLTDVKNKGAGILIGVALSGGVFGAGMTKLLDFWVK